MSSTARPGNTLGNATHRPTPLSPGAGQFAAFEPEAGQVAPMLEDAVHKIEAYGREKPWNLALIAAGVGFILGWKLKPW